jgi:23S rRNA (uridine2552-2'-O)-methyltransferase
MMGKRWIREKKKDPYYRKAKEEAYRSRAAYKLKQINEKFRLIRKGDRVLDLGAAPGGWLQVAREIVGEGGIVVGVDREEIPPLKEANVSLLQRDLRDPELLEAIREITPYVDVLLSDASPDISGVWGIDHLLSVELCRTALGMARGLLRPGGNLLMKVFQGEETEALFREVKRSFTYTKRTKPRASRGQSAETYLIGKGFRGGDAPRKG